MKWLNNRIDEYKLMMENKGIVNRLVGMFVFVCYVFLDEIWSLHRA